MRDRAVVESQPLRRLLEVPPDDVLELLELDTIVWLSGTDAGLNDIRNMPMRQKLKATAQGREVFVGALLGGAFSFGSPLSIDYLLDKFVPLLVAAVDGDPKTAVPASQ